MKVKENYAYLSCTSLGAMYDVYRTQKTQTARNTRLRQYSVDEEVEDTSHVPDEGLGGEEQPISEDLEAKLQTHEHHEGILCNLMYTSYTLSSRLLFNVKKNKI